jgi:beta-phosphoglucomutase-like phosphatase (HAD superfamily)
MTIYKGLIFDFNGVLWWDNALHEEAWRDFSARLRGYPLTDLELAEHVHGRNNRYTMEYLSGRKLPKEEQQRLSDDKEGMYQQLCLALGDEFRLSPGAEPLLDFLVAEKIPRTIATASDKGNVDFFIEHLGLAHWFDLGKIIYDDGTITGKPAPDYYLLAAAAIDLPPEQCVVVEDSLSGMRSARAAGIGCIFAVVGDAGHALRAELPPGIEVIDDLSQLDRALFG